MNDTSLWAYEDLPDLDILRGRIYQWLLSNIHGGTSYEIAAGLELDYIHVWRRMSELVRSGHVRDSGIRRKGEAGRHCTVWVAVC